MNIRISGSLIHELVFTSIDVPLIVGEQVKSWHTIFTPAAFLSEIHEFLERFSLSEQARNPLGRKTKIKKVSQIQLLC